MRSSEETYAFENARARQRERLRALEAALDDATIHRLESLGVERGSRCLEVGAGGGSIAEWLCERVGDDGDVVATDLDTTVLRERSRPNLHVRVHNVERDPLPSNEFELVHLRLVLAWLKEPALALRRLVAALKPGGWLLAEEMDFVSVTPEPQQDREACASFARAVGAHNAVLTTGHSFDPAYGRRLASELVEAGLKDVDCEERVSLWRGAEPGGTAWRLTFEQLREPMIASGLASRADVESAITLCANPRFTFRSQTTLAAWGRRDRATRPRSREHRHSVGAPPGSSLSP
jgi:ubiquinone/menaquinone biosynthesis C-methylase UbiE